MNNLHEPVFPLVFSPNPAMLLDIVCWHQAYRLVVLPQMNRRQIVHP